MDSNTRILINGDVHHIGGSLAQLEQDLTFFEACGYDGVEISVDGVDAIVGGRLMRSQVDRVLAVTRRFALHYTVHAPGRLNLAFPPRGRSGAPELAMETDVFAATLDFCAALGAPVMVYHSGLMGLHQAAAGLGPLPGAGALEEARAQEVETLRELMPLAASRGVTVGMENRDPHLWELAVLRQAGLPEAELLTYHSGLSIPAVVRQIREVGHPNLGMTLDLGHLFIAANLFGWDYLEAVREAAPWVRHVHAHDNCGRLGSVHTDLHERIPYADGDVHLPPGWGCLPLQEALAQLDGYEGAIVLEIQPRCREHFADALGTVRDMLDEITNQQRS